MKISVLPLLAIIIPFSLSAQIKTVSDEMVKSAEKEGEQSFSVLATQFQRFDPEERLTFGKTICTGERFYVMDNTLWYYSGGSREPKKLPEGYYKIENIYLTRESLESKTVKFYGSDMTLYDYLDFDTKYGIETKKEILNKNIGVKPPFETPSGAVYEIVSEQTKERFYVNGRDKNMERAMPTRSFEHCQKELVGKDVYLVVPKYVNAIKDALTGDTKQLTTHIFRCVDIAVDGNRGDWWGTNIVLILENAGTRLSYRVKEGFAEDYGFVYYQTIGDFENSIMLKETYDRRVSKSKALLAEKQRAQAEKKKALQTKYGEYFGKLVSDKKVVVGMREDMGIDAWGHPVMHIDQKNSSGNVSVWYYGLSTTVSFINGKVSAVTEIKF